MLSFEEDHYPPRDDDDFDDWDDDASEEETSTTRCFHCGAEIYEDSVRCPACGSYDTQGPSSVWHNRSILWIVLGLLGIGAVLIALLRP